MIFFPFLFLVFPLCVAWTVFQCYGTFRNLQASSVLLFLQKKDKVIFHNSCQPGLSHTQNSSAIHSLNKYHFAFAATLS